MHGEVLSVLIVLTGLLAFTHALPQPEMSEPQPLNTIDAYDPKIFYHGRWDFQQGSWW